MEQNKQLGQAVWRNPAEMSWWFTRVAEELRMPAFTVVAWPYKGTWDNLGASVLRAALAGTVQAHGATQAHGAAPMVRPAEDWYHCQLWACRLVRCWCPTKSVPAWRPRSFWFCARLWQWLS